MLLCDAVARGLIQPLRRQDSAELAPPGDKDVNKPKKGMEKAVSGVLLDPVALQDVHKASEVCQYLCMCVGCGPWAPVCGCELSY